MGAGGGSPTAAGEAWTRFPAPAKLNLFLHVLGRRDDGRHEIQTVFQFVDLCDSVSLRLRSDREIRRLSGAASVPAEQDLAVRAARALRDRVGADRGVDIAVDKRIPIGGGLGGGSSDAATVLRALDRLWGSALGEDRLADLGLELGADVPVFVRGRAAFAGGVGERLEPVEPPSPWYLLVFPGREGSVGVSTEAVFESPELTRNSAATTIRGFLAHGAQQPGTRFGRNDCEPVVRKMVPAVGEALDWLSDCEGLRGARMTGTGAGVFAEAEDETAARRMAEALPPRWTAWVVRGLNRSPLLDALEAG